MLFIIFLSVFLFFNVKIGFAYKIFSISLPDNYGKVGKTKTFYIGAAEPAFGLIYDLKPPKSVFILYPNGTSRRLPILRENFLDRALNTQRIGYETKVTPDVKGDFYICIKSDYTLNPEGILEKFSVKTPFHVETEKGWENLCGFELEIKPYTMPYGFRKNGIFWGQVFYRGKPLENGTVEVERFSPDFLRPEDFPRDSYGEINYPYLKKITKLTKNGFFIVSLEEPGWWVITVEVNSGKKVYDNSVYPLKLVHLFWIYVFGYKKNMPFYEYFPIPHVKP